MTTIVSPTKTENKVTVTEDSTIVAVTEDTATVTVISGSDGVQGVAGADGATGATGSSVLSGNGVPSNALGSDDDHYLDQTFFHLYVKVDGAWVDRGAYGGTQGPAGTIEIGDVTSVASGEPATVTNTGSSTVAVLDFELVTGGIGTLSDGDVTLAKMANLAQNIVIGRVTDSTGVPEALSAANIRTIIGVESGATADQTGAEIKTAYEAVSNAYTDTLNTKLNGIEASADVTDATNVAAAGALMDSELAGIAAVKATTGTFLSADESKLDGIEASATADQTGAEIVTVIYGESDVNQFTDTLKGKLDGIAAGAEVNVNADWNSSSGDSQISNKPTIPSGNAIIDWTGDGAGTIHASNYTDTNTVYAHPHHSGDVVSVNDGVTTIQPSAVDIAMLSASGTASSSTFLRGDNTWSAPAAAADNSVAMAIALG